MQDVPSAAAEIDDPADKPSVARVHLLGERLDLRDVEPEHPIAISPFIIRAGAAGHVVYFRYGVVVTFGLTSQEEASLLIAARRLVSDPLEAPESEQIQVIARPDGDAQIDSTGRIVVTEITPPRLQMVADVLAKHLILSHYETRLAPVFDRFEPLAAMLRRTGRIAGETDVYLQQIGGVLLIQQKMVGRVEITEHPEVLWEHPELERFYARLEAEYELRERARALDRKLEFIFRSAETLHRLVEGRRTLRLEWYVVGLIVLEILLSLYGVVGASPHGL
jgi:uncharacterized Rmd1/YagE family protein